MFIEIIILRLSKKQKKRRKNNKKDTLELEEENSDSATDENKPQGEETLSELNASQSNISNEEAKAEDVWQVEEKSETIQKETDPKPSICKVCNEVLNFVPYTVIVFRKNFFICSIFFFLRYFHRALSYLNTFQEKDTQQQN